MFLLGISPAKVRFFSDATPPERAKAHPARSVTAPATNANVSTGRLTEKAASRPGLPVSRTEKAIAPTVRNAEDPEGPFKSPDASPPIPGTSRTG